MTARPYDFLNNNNRYLGEDLPLRFIVPEKKGFFARIFA